MANGNSAVLDAPNKPLSASAAQTGKEEKMIELTNKFSVSAFESILQIAALEFGIEKFSKLSIEAKAKKVNYLFRTIALKGLVSKRNSKLTSEYNKEARDVDSLVDSGMSRKDAEVEIWGVSGTIRRQILDTAKKAPLF